MMNRLLLNRYRQIARNTDTPNRDVVLNLIESHLQALDKIDQLTYTQVRP